MAKTKAKKAKKAVVKKAAIPIPKLRWDGVADCRGPHTTETSGKLAAALTTFYEKAEEYKAACKAHVAGGGTAADMPQFNPKHFPDVNKGKLSQSAQEKREEREYNGEEVEGYPKYNPVLIDALKAIKPTSRLRRGKDSDHPKPPRDWDEKEYGSWYVLDEDDERNAPSGWFFDEAEPRRCHSVSAEKMVVDPAKSIITFGNNRYVVGNGTFPGAAVMLLLTTKRGNYRAGDLIRKRMAHAGDKNVPDVVFRIEDRANNGGGVTLKGDWKNNIKAVVYMPGQAMTAGFLFDSNGKRLTAKQIRALDSKTTGLKFKTVRQVLDDPIKGKDIPWSAIWKELQVVDKENLSKMRKRVGRSDDYVKGSPQACSHHNHEVTTRVGPHESHPMGNRSCEADVVPYKITGGEEMFFGSVIGDRSNFNYSTKVEDEVEVEVEVEGEVEETTPKAAKKTAKKRTKRAAKPKPEDEAPPVEAETENEVEAEVAEVEVETA